MQYNFDQTIERRNTDSIKWQRYNNDIIPLWVADMDFPSPEPVIQALHKRVDHRVFGYAKHGEHLLSLIRERLKKLYGWDIKEEHIIFVPGVVTGLNLAFTLFADPGDAVLVQPPVYSHFITDPVSRNRRLIDPPLKKTKNTYEIDFDAFEKAIDKRTRIYVLCNPHNPVGRVFRKDELDRLASICLRNNILICSDEIHCELLYPGHKHLPIASIDEDIADRTITFMSPSKTFNLAGLSCSFAIITNPELRETWKRGSEGLIPYVNIMGLAATEAAYKSGQQWLDQCLAYLKRNRDFLIDYIEKKIPVLSVSRVEGTYLAWINCQQAGILDDPSLFFLREAKVALNRGAECGRGGEGFVRLNFACPRKTLVNALDCIADALKRL